MVSRGLSKCTSPWSVLLRWIVVVWLSCGEWLSTFVLVDASLAGVVQDLNLDVVLSDAAPSDASYRIQVTRAFFGRFPSMDPSHVPYGTLVRPPDNNPLLCNFDNNDNINDALSSATATTASEVAAAVVARTSSLVMLVPRGVCTFERKAWVAQQMGARAMLLYGNLASRYTLNTTTSDATANDIIYPTNRSDYDCGNGRAWINSDDLYMDQLPYDTRNDDLLSGDDETTNLCHQKDPNHLRRCKSKVCLLTGNQKQTQDQQVQMEACCAWDVPIYLYFDTEFNKTVQIPSAYLTLRQGNQLIKEMHDNRTVQVRLSARWRPQYNFSSVLIWVLGVAVAATAAYMTADDYRSLMRKILKRRERLLADNNNNNNSSRTRRHADPNNAPRNTDRPPSEEVVELNEYHALGFIVLASTSLLVLFYFKIYSAVRVFYAFGCSTAVSQILLDPLLRCLIRRNWISLPFGRSQQQQQNQTGSGGSKSDVLLCRSDEWGDLTFVDLTAHALGYCLGATWTIVSFVVPNPENHLFFWVTQDVFGACMCILFLRVIRLNSIRVASILLSVFFVYDVFFVFVTPLLFQGKSVMVTVATSGGPPTADPSWCEKYPHDKSCQGGNPLPMLLAVPRLLDYQDGSSLLGLGDIVLPGLLLSFAARFDAAKSLLGIMGGGSGSIHSYNNCPEQQILCAWCSWCCKYTYIPNNNNNSPITSSSNLCWATTGGYFWPLIAAYAIGLLMANVAVYVMKMGQPALLYLVPCCLGTMLFIGWRKRELRDLWDGPKAIRTADDILFDDEQERQRIQLERQGQQQPSVTDSSMKTTAPSQQQQPHQQHDRLPVDEQDDDGVTKVTIPTVPSAQEEDENGDRDNNHTVL